MKDKYTTSIVHMGFNTRIARDVGTDAAILYTNIEFWCKKNKSNDRNFHDGYYWTYNSKKAFADLFDYLTEGQIRTILKKLIKNKYIVTGNYNKVKYDKTSWYRINKMMLPNGDIIFNPKINRETGSDCKDEQRVLKEDKSGKSLCKNEQRDNKSLCKNEQRGGAKRTDRSVQMNRPIPDINHIINTDLKPQQNQKLLNKEITPIDIGLGKLLRDQIKSHHPSLREPNIDSWAYDISKMRRIDKRTPEQIAGAIMWAHQDDFWKGVILSPAKVRKHFDTLVIKAMVKEKKKMFGSQELQRILKSI